MQCPNCDASLRTIEYEGVRIETCDGCKGEWLDADELGHIVKAREVRFTPEERQAIAQAAAITGVPLDKADRDLVCPKCGATTDPVNYGGDTGILIDRCTACRGFWLDGTEIEKIQKLVEAWDDGLPDDLAKYGPRMRELAAKADAKDDVEVSRFHIVNVAINGILDLMFH